MYFVILLLVISGHVSHLDGSATFNFEKMRMFGGGRKMIPDFRNLNPNKNYGYGYGHPGPMPTTVEPKSIYNSGPDHNIYQGRRYDDDKLVFNKSFQSKALEDDSQLYHCDAVFDCVVTFLSIETKESIPILLRGGVGYNHINAVVRAKPSKSLKGNVKAYCRADKNKVSLRNGDTLNQKGYFYNNDLHFNDITEQEKIKENLI